MSLGRPRKVNICTEKGKQELFNRESFIIKFTTKHKILIQPEVFGNITLRFSLHPIRIVAIVLYPVATSNFEENGKIQFCHYLYALFFPLTFTTH
jgi:hypothetical protein